MHCQGSLFIPRLVFRTQGAKFCNYDELLLTIKRNISESPANVGNQGNKLLVKCNDVTKPIRLGPGSTIPLFLVHGGDGLASRFYYVANQLDCAAYAFQTGDKYYSKDCVIPIMDSLVKEYINEVKKVQPCGPYNLGGYSAGASIAFEMAVQMENKNDRVANLILMDGYCTFNVTSSEAWKSFISTLKFQMSPVADFTEAEKKIFFNLPTEDHIEARRIVLDTLDKKLKSNPKVREMSRNAIVGTFSTMITLICTIDAHKPSTNFKGKTSLIKARSTFKHFQKSKDNNFQQYCDQPMDIYFVNGDHESFLDRNSAMETCTLVNKILWKYT